MLSALYKSFTCIVVIFICVALPLMALAGDVDPAGEKLRSLKNDPKYQAALKAKAGKTTGTKWDGICAAEIATFIGGIIWGNAPCWTPAKNTKAKFCPTV